jgi:hypothetical protein
MIPMIVNTFNEIVFKACARFGKEENVEAKEIQVLFKLNEGGELIYSILKNYNPLKDVTFNQILNVKIDFRGFGQIVPPFITNTLITYGEKLEKNPTDLMVMCIVTGENKIVSFLYDKDKKPIEQIILEDL